MNIAFNARFVTEMLSNLDTGDVVLELSSPSRPGILKPSEQADSEDLLMLVMPLMTNV